MPEASVVFDEKIRRVIVEKLNVLNKNDFFEGKEELLFVIGNGLTRSAASVKGIDDISWEEWIKYAVRESESDVSFDYIRKKGYNLTELIQLVVRSGDITPNEKLKVFKILYENIKNIDPLPLHKLLFDISSKIITTNYDDLFERSIIGSNNKLKVLYTTRSLSVDSSHINEQIMESPEATLAKVHGTLPIKNIWNWKSWRTDISDGYLPVILDRKQYEQLVQMSQNEFKSRFHKYIDLIDKENQIVIVIGLGLTGEDLFIRRIFEGMKKSHKLAFSVDYDWDPLINFVLSGFEIIRLPMGLSSSIYGRLLSQYILLEEIIPLLDITDTRKKLIGEKISQARKLQFYDGLQDIFKRSFPEINVLVSSVGSVSKNRVIGVDVSRSYGSLASPPLGSWLPKYKENNDSKILYTVEIGGNGAVPTLVLDALGIPCSIISQVFDDDAGYFVLNEISKTNMLDYSAISQKFISKNGMSKKTEENYVLTWFGLESNIEIYIDSDYDIDIESLQKRAPILYLTKVNINKIIKEIINMEGYYPLIIFDISGWYFDEKVLEFINERSGIIITTSKTCLGWLIGSKRQGIFDSDTKVAINKLKKRLPKDDRLNIFLNNELISEIISNNESKIFFKMLSNIRALVVNCGELGTLYWLNSPGYMRWKWCRYSGFGEVSKGFFSQMVNFAEIRTGLGCGESFSAGFMAVMVISLGPNMKRDIQNKDIEWAIGWGNWMGMHKLRFFSINDFLYNSDCGIKNIKEWIINCMYSQNFHEGKMWVKSEIDYCYKFEFIVGDVIVNGKCFNLLTEYMKENMRFIGEFYLTDELHQNEHENNLKKWNILKKKWSNSRKLHNNTCHLKNTLIV